MSVPANFRAFRIHDDAQGYRSGIEAISLGDLNPGEVVIKTAYSSVNFKDALAGTGQGKILRQVPAGRRHRRGRPRGRLDRPGLQGGRYGAGHRQRAVGDARRRLQPSTRGWNRSGSSPCRPGSACASR
jgi:hypothetical protein